MHRVWLHLDNSEQSPLTTSARSGSEDRLRETHQLGPTVATAQRPRKRQQRPDPKSDAHAMEENCGPCRQLGCGRRGMSADLRARRRLRRALTPNTIA